MSRFVKHTNTQTHKHIQFAQKTETSTKPSFAQLETEKTSLIHKWSIKCWSISFIYLFNTSCVRSYQPTSNDDHNNNFLFPVTCPRLTWKHGAQCNLHRCAQLISITNMAEPGVSVLRSGVCPTGVIRLWAQQVLLTQSELNAALSGHTGRKTNHIPQHLNNDTDTEPLWNGSPGSSPEEPGSETQQLRGEGMNRYVGTNQ